MALKMKSQLKKILLFCSLFGEILCFRNEIPLVLDIMDSYEKPTAVVAKLCWDSHDKKILMSDLMNSKRAKTVLFIEKVQELDKFRGHELLVIADLECPDMDSFLKQANDGEKFRNRKRWLMVPIQLNPGIIPNRLANLDIIIDSEVMVAYKMEEDKVLLNLVYRIDSTKRFRAENYGIWTKQTGLVISEDMMATLLMRRKDFEGKSIPISMVVTDNSTASDLYKLKYIAIDNVSKATFHNLLPLFDFLNSTYTLLFTQTWGYFINNTWTGMVGDIHRGHAEIGGSISFMNRDRLEFVSYMTQTIPITSQFVFREPPLSFQNNLYLLPFKSAVWMCIGAMVLILIVILYVNAKWELARNGNDLLDLKHNQLLPNISDIAIFVLGAVAQQGGNKELKGYLGRIVSFLMFLIFLFLYTSYSANIVALLQSSSDQIRTLSDLLHSRLELGIEETAYNRHYFPRATEPVRKAIYETKVLKTGYKPNFMSLEEGVKKLQDKNVPFAFMMNLGMGYKKVEEFFEEHEKCGLVQIEYYSSTNPWLCSRQKSAYKEWYKIGAQRAIEHGLADRVNRMFYVRKPSCNSRGGSFGSVNMLDFHPVLLLLLYGMLAAVLLLGLEILMYRKLQKIYHNRFINYY